MKFPWNKYEEFNVNKRSTLQIFITNDCNLRCDGCFVRNIMGDSKSHMSMEEYKRAVDTACLKGVERITLIGGEPLKHPQIREMMLYNQTKNLKTTIFKWLLFR